MTSCTVSDFLDRIIAAAKSEQGIDALDLPEQIIDTIKIHSDKWGTASLLNYKAADYMRAVQQDVINAWNEATGEHVTPSRLDDYPFLIVEFTISDGCIQFDGKLCKQFRKIMSMIPPESRKSCIIAICLAVAAFPVSSCISKIVDSGILAPKEVQIIKAQAEAKKSAGVIINNIGNGSVTYTGRDWTPQEIKSEKKSIASIEPVVPVMLDGSYTIDACKMDGDKIHLVAADGKSFMADTSTLTDAPRTKLGNLIGQSFNQRKNLTLELQINAKSRAGTTSDHVVVGIGPSRAPAGVEFSAKLDAPQKPSKGMQQASLLDFQ